MPRKPPSPCTQRGCRKHATNRGRCEDHQRPAWHTSTASATERGYGSAWRRISKAKLAVNPLCERCLSEGRTTAAKSVDHIRPKARGGTDRWENLMSLCQPCHDEKTQQDAAEGRSVAARTRRRT